MKKMLVLSAVLALTLMAGVANADVIADYQFTGASAASGDTDSNSTANAFGVNGGATLVSDWAQHMKGSMATSFNTGDYYEFVVDVASGYEMDLTSLVFDFGVRSKKAGTYTGNYDLRSSVDGTGYDTSIASGSKTLTTPSDTELFAWDTGITVSLAGTQYQDLAGTDAITFRLYNYYTQDTGVVSGNMADNFTLNGSVTPEPATMSLLAIGGIGMLVRRRRRRA